ncbi:MAG TPA: hypothetical protein VGQ83_26795 [Polyangia bacterium]|jgi:hypothetical protein
MPHDGDAGLRKSIDALTKRLKVHEAQTAKTIKALEARLERAEEYIRGLEIKRGMIEAGRMQPDHALTDEEWAKRTEGLAYLAARPKKQPKVWHKGRLVPEGEVHPASGRKAR